MAKELAGKKKDDLAVLSFPVDREIAKKLDQIATREDRSRSSLLRRIVQEAVLKEKTA